MNASTEESVPLRTELREAVSELKGISKRAWSDNHFYRVDRTNASEYFGVLPKWKELLRKYFRELHEQGVPVTYVDICGRATADSLGADENYSFSLQPIASFLRPGSNREETRVRGDLFNTRDFNAFLQLIRRNGDQPAFVSFEPIVGLQEFTPHKRSTTRPHLNEEVTNQILVRHLTRVVSILRPGGYIYLGPPFQLTRDLGAFFRGAPQSEYRESLQVKELCKKLHCTVKVGATIAGPHWLIRKRSPRRNL
jgi:hypothetical protein